MRRAILAAAISFACAGALAEEPPPADWPKKGDRAYVSLTVGTLVPAEWNERLRASEKDRLACDNKYYCTYRHPICEELTIAEIRSSSEGRAAWEGDVELCALQDRNDSGRGICFRFRDAWRMVAFADPEACSGVLAGILGDAFARGLVKGLKNRPLPFEVNFDDYGVWHITPSKRADEPQEQPE